MELSSALLKFFTVWLTPLGIALLLMLLALVTRRRLPLVFAVIWLWALSTPLVAERLGGTLEYRDPIVPLAALPVADVIVVLGGAVDAPVPPWFPEPNLGAAADRLLFGAQLWRAGKAPVVLYTGGSRPDQVPEAQTAAGILELLGVPSSALLLEGASRTTRQNAAMSAPLLRAKGVRRALLVTSAWHLPRSLETFRAALPEIEWIPAGCDPHTFSEIGFAGARWMPNTEALNFSRMIFKEWLGLAWARLGGR